MAAFRTCGACGRIYDADTEGPGSWASIHDEAWGKYLLVDLCPACTEARKAAVGGS